MTVKGDLLREKLIVTNDLMQNKIAGLANEDSKKQNAILNTLIKQIEKRLKYEGVKTALKNKKITPQLETIFRELEFDKDKIAEIKKAFDKGKLSNDLIKEVNKEWLNISTDRVLKAKNKLLANYNGDVYNAYKALHSEFLMYGIGIKIDLLDYKISEKEKIEINKLLKKGKLSKNKELYGYLWKILSQPYDDSELVIKLDEAEGSMGAPRFLKSELFLDRFANPKFKGTKPGIWSNIVNGIDAYGKDEADDKVFLYMMIALVIMATFSTINGVPYYALGIELSPSYDGRTKLVMWRSIISTSIGFIRPWLFPFVLLPIFIDPIQGTFYLGIICACVSIPLLIYSMTHCKERIKLDKNDKTIPFFKSIKDTVRIPEFWRIVILYVCLGNSLAIFNMVGGYITIYYVFGGSLMHGATYLALVGSFATGLAMLALPLVKWICDKYEKHNALRFAIVMMMIGCSLKWWCYDPQYPALLFVIPPFFAIGISSMYTVMQTLMADVTDVDELKTGSRREGMFGAVNATIMKAAQPIGAVMAGIVVVASGFDIDLGGYQKEGVFSTMRLIFSVFPTLLLGFCLLLLKKYPLTRKRMFEIKAILTERRAAKIADETE